MITEDLWIQYRAKGVAMDQDCELVNCWNDTRHKPELLAGLNGMLFPITEGSWDLAFKMAKRSGS